MITAYEAYNYKEYSRLQEIERQIVAQARDPTANKCIELYSYEKLNDKICFELAKNGYEIFSFPLINNEVGCRIDWSGKYNITAPIKDGERWGKFGWHPIKDYQYIRNY